MASFPLFFFFSRKDQKSGEMDAAHIFLSVSHCSTVTALRGYTTLFLFVRITDCLVRAIRHSLSLSLWRPVLMLLDHNAVFQPVCQLNQSSIPLPYTGALLTSRHCCHLFLSLLIFLVLKQGQIRDSVIFSFWSRPLPCFASPYTHTLRPPSQSSLDSPSSQVH